MFKVNHWVQRLNLAMNKFRLILWKGVRYDNGPKGGSQHFPVSSSASITMESFDTLEVVFQKIICMEPDRQQNFID